MKKRTGRTLFLLAGSIIVLILIVGGVVFALRSNKGSPSPPPKSTTTPRSSPTATPRRAERGEAPSAALAAPLLVSAAGQPAFRGVVIRVSRTAAAVAIVSEL